MAYLDYPKLSAVYLCGNQRRASFTGWLVLLGLFECLSGCTVQVSNDPEKDSALDELPFQLSAVIEVQRKTTFLNSIATFETPQRLEERLIVGANPGESAKEASALKKQSTLTEGNVLASMVNMTSLAEEDSWRGLEQVGLLTFVPEPNTCIIDQKDAEKGTDSTQLSLADLQHFELFSTTQPHDMAARAFPGVTPRMRGVVYTSRARDGLGLSDAGKFELMAEGSHGEVIQGNFDSPATPHSLTVNGKVFSGLESLDQGEELLFEWDAAPLTDEIVIVGAFDAEHSIHCSFAGQAGTAELSLTALPTFAPESEAWLSFRILKETHESQSGDDRYAEEQQELGYYARVEHSWLKSVVF